MRPILAALLLATAAFSVGQTPPSPPPANSTVEATETVRFLREAWERVRKEGPDAVNRIQSGWPAAMRTLGGRVEELRKLVLDGVDPVERVMLMAELWRVRGSVNLLALLTPENLSKIAGLDPDQLRRLDRNVREVERAVRPKAQH